MYHEARKSAAFEGGCSALHSLWEGTAKVLQNSVLLFFETAAILVLSKNQFAKAL